MDIASLMWDETGRDYDGERRELSRTAALADAERLVGEFVYRATSDVDLINRLALAEPQLQAIASERLYPVAELTGDLKQRWQLLSTARAAAEQKTAAARKVTAAQERAMDAVTARLAAIAAQENPSVPMAECLKLATEAVRKHADAYPLAYESWGGTADGPVTDRAKHWQPGGMPRGNTGQAADPGPNGGAGTYDSVHQKLDELENRLNGASSPSGPSQPTTASLDPVAAGIWQRLKNWWSDDTSSSSTPAATTPAHSAPSASPAPAPAATTEPEHVGPYDPTGWHGGAPGRHAEDLADRATEKAHDDSGRREFDEIMRRLDNDQADMQHKFDNPGYNDHRDWRARQRDADRLQQANDSVTDNLERRLNEAGAPKYHPAPIQHSLFD